MKTHFEWRLAARSLLAAASLAAATVVIAGCGGLSGNGTATTVAVPIAAAKITGRVHGGQQPVSGAVIQLYAVGITGRKSAATPLVTKTVTSGQDGSFSITGDWDCTSNTAVYGDNPLLYITANGGNPGLPGTVDNSAISLIAALGSCSGVNDTTSISLNELTTVAATYALAPFMADATHIGAQGANVVGLANAFKTANLLVDTATGGAPGRSLPVNATVPVSELNSLADILASCVNSTGVDGTCSTLFSAATPNGGTSPTDVTGVILNIVSSPASQVSTLFNLGRALAPFQPALASSPADWTLAVNFTGGGLNAPAGLAVDAAGNLWVANAAGNSVTELSDIGTLLTGSTGYTGSNNIFGAQGIAVDTNGNVWVADTLLSSVVELNVDAGVVKSSSTFTNGGLNGPTGIAIDSRNNLWVANFAGGSVTELNSSGIPVGSSPLTGSAMLVAPSGIAIDGVGNVWVSDNQASDVVEFRNDQVLLSAAGYTDGSMLAPEGVAIDRSERAWIADTGTNAASLLGPNGDSLLSTPLLGGGLSTPSALAVDGQGTVWAANCQTSGSISELTFGQLTPLSPASGLGTFNSPCSIAVDASGSLWTANSGDDSVSEIVGIATPAIVPLAANAGP